MSETSTNRGTSQEASTRIRRSFKGACRRLPLQGCEAHHFCPACIHCRQRKARCDLGDLDAPRDPPCTRCRREGIPCEFLPSRRGGQIPFNAGKRKRDPNSEGKGFYVERSPPPKVPMAGTLDELAEASKEDGEPWLRGLEASRESSIGEGEPTVISAMGHIGSLESSADNRLPDQHISHLFGARGELGHSLNNGDSAAAAAVLPPPLSSNDIFPHTHATSTAASPSEASGSSVKSGERRSTDRSSRPHTTSRGRTSGSLTAATLRNPADALDLLALGAAGRIRDKTNDGRQSEATGGEASSSSFRVNPPTGPRLDDFPPVKLGIISGRKLCELVDVFFTRHHFLFPVVPYTRVPRTESDVARFASEELHLTTVFCVIASRHDRSFSVHDKLWGFLQTLINDINLGKVAPVGAVESLLLLSEFLPRLCVTSASQLNSEENRCSWMLVGSAVRLAYMLGLDQRAMPAGPSTPSQGYCKEEEHVQRERIAWIYCYMFDRQISVRTGKTSISRGHGVVFSGRSRKAYADAARDFPSLRFVANTQDDFASLLKANLELTQILSSCHDVLYPTRARTINLDEMSDLSKYVDEFSRSLAGFRKTWELKRWATFRSCDAFHHDHVRADLGGLSALVECVWITFHYVRLYCFGFAFQAHIQRAMANADPDDHDPVEIFPDGVMGSPDAESILEAIDAAADLLRLVTDRLHPGGALPYLPRRFFMYFAYAGVFLLKAVHVEAVAPKDQITVTRLLRRLIFVLACASSDQNHPAVRFAHLLNGILRINNNGQESAAATRPSSPAPASDVSARATLPHNLTLGSTNQVARASESVDLLSADTAASSGPSGNAMDGPNVTTPFPMLPFTASQTFHQLATSLGENQSSEFALDQFDLGFGSSDWVQPAVGNEGFGFLLDDEALEFWHSFESRTRSDWDWNDTAMEL